MSDTRLAEDSMNEQLIAAISDYMSSNKDGVEIDVLADQLDSYKELAQEEITGSRGQRNLAIHNTVREVYEQQIELIEELYDIVDDDPVDTNKLHLTLGKLTAALGQGESIG